METKQLNRDYKRLWKRYQDIKGMQHLDIYWSELEAFKIELKRLYWADNRFNFANYLSMRIFFSLNNTCRVIPFNEVVVDVGI